jgi:hypothetical protein
MKRTKPIISLVLAIAIAAMLIPTVAKATVAKATVGKVQLRIEGYDQTLLSASVSMDVFDLQDYGITDTSADFTVLHAVIKVLLDAGYDPKDENIIEYNKGSYISSVLGITATGNAGWMYTLNDESPYNSIKDQTLKDGDSVVIYYIENWMTCSYSTFGTASSVSVDAFDTVQLNLIHQVTDPATWMTSYVPLGGAEILIDNEKTDIFTDTYGNAYITFDFEGSYSITAEKYTDGINTISRPAFTVDVAGEGVKVNIYMDDEAFISCVDHITDMTALDAITSALAQLGHTLIDDKVAVFNGGSYISSLLGLTAEGNAGWMYTVNNNTSWSSISEQILNEGDTLDVYYISDWMTCSYTYFDMADVTCVGSSKATFRLYRHATDPVTWATVSVPCANEEILLDGKKAGYVTDENGYITISLNEIGTYAISTLKGNPSVSYTEARIHITTDNEPGLDDFIDASDVGESFVSCFTDAVEKGIVKGNGERRLDPKVSVTKAEFITMLIRVKGYEVPGKYTKRYSDITEENWFYGYAQVAFRYGLAGSEAGNFLPETVLTQSMLTYGICKAFDTDITALVLNDDMLTMFSDGISREEAVYAIYYFKGILADQ